MKYAIVSNPRDRISAGLAHAGSIAIVSLNLARGLAARNDVLLVASRGAGEAARERLEPRIEVLRMERKRSRLRKFRELAATAFEGVPPYFLWSDYEHEYYEQAARALSAESPDVIHIQNYGQSAAIFRRHCPDARIVVHLHDTCVAQVGEALAKRALGQADLVVTCSAYVARTVSAAHPWLKVPVAAINNGVDVAEFQPREAPATPHGELKIAYVGRLSPEKGVHVLMEAFNTVIEQAPQARLMLVGGASMFAYSTVKLFKRDPHWAAIFGFYGSNPAQRLFRHLYRSGKRYVDTLRSMQSGKAAAATRLLGDLPHERVAAVIAEADVIVVPSVCDEPFGIPAVEAMSAGVPVVASAAGGLCDIVQNGRTGLLATRSDARSLANAILELLADAPRRADMGRSARAAAMTFTWSRAAENLLAALERSGIAEPRATAVPALS